MVTDHNFRNRGGHVEVTDSYGHFVLSADTMGEATKELREVEMGEHNLEREAS